MRAVERCEAGPLGARFFVASVFDSGFASGLETAPIGETVAGLDMLSIGPQIEFPHSPDERVSIPTVERFWRLRVGVLDDLSK